MNSAILPSTESSSAPAAAPACCANLHSRQRDHCARVTPKNHPAVLDGHRLGNPVKRYTAGRFRSFLERFHSLPERLRPHRAFLRETYHTVLQILSDRIYPTHLTETLPRLPFDKQPTQERMRRWWQEFRSWLKTLNREQRTALEQQTVLWRAAYWECGPVK